MMLTAIVFIPIIYTNLFPEIIQQKCRAKTKKIYLLKSVQNQYNTIPLLKFFLKNRNVIFQDLNSILSVKFHQ